MVKSTTETRLSVLLEPILQHTRHQMVSFPRAVRGRLSLALAERLLGLAHADLIEELAAEDGRDLVGASTEIARIVEALEADGPSINGGSTRQN